ncbi:LysR family transcriptional regulator [Shimia thalassica]|uniref:LysR family transcriptional regulator n=1 Tax=Shimia thalassica TaxID=1715693 RepID=UPI0026E1A2F3|nr:LysR family transcriptional regulator [Shimia thalassica]MDO6482618.1 LysR family transcriptional regulator [Shimia thalassica]
MEKLPNLVWIRSFDAAARHLNFTAAADELGITQTAVSLHIRSLEADLRCQLFTRAARKLTLTEMGQAYSMTLRRALADIALSTNSLFGAGATQGLTVRVPISTAALWLVQRLPEFKARHPGISIRLVSNIWAESAGQDDVDVELRLGKGHWQNSASRRISHEAMVPIASSRQPADLSAQTLHNGPLIQILGYEDMWGSYLGAFGKTADPTAVAYAVDTTVAAVGIVAGGGGHAVILERFARRAIKDGQPIEIVGDAVPLDQAHYILGNPGKPSSAKAKEVFEAWLEEIFGNDALGG